MKLGICTNMIASTDDRFGVSHLNEIAEAGFEYIELPMATIMSVDEQEYQKLVKTISDSPVKCEVVCSLMRPDISVVGDEYDKNKLVEYIKVAATRANDLHVKSVVFGSPRSRSMRFPPYSLSDTLLQLAESLHIIMNHMDQYGISVLMEPLNRIETNLINTFEQSASFCRKVGRKGFRSMIDFAHFKVNGEPYSSIIENMDMLAHIHIARPFERKFPMDEREEDYSGFIKKLSEAGYNETISIEAVSKDVKNDAKAANILLRKLISRYYM
ncbi:MAG TPA: sugar phosphate isomerase/epimerase family protein [Ruminiclostridium sp.]